MRCARTSSTSTTTSATRSDRNCQRIRATDRPERGRHLPVRNRHVKILELRAADTGKEIGHLIFKESRAYIICVSVTDLVDTALLEADTAAAADTVAHLRADLAEDGISDSVDVTTADVAVDVETEGNFFFIFLNFRKTCVKFRIFEKFIT
jgi:hypothetical protein